MNSSGASTTLAMNGEQTPSTAVIDLLARVKDVDPLDLDPLYAAIDPDALDALCDAHSGFESIEFTYSDHAVSITATGTSLEITVEPIYSSFERSVGAEPADTESSL